MKLGWLIKEVDEANLDAFSLTGSGSHQSTNPQIHQSTNPQIHKQRKKPNEIPM